LRNTRWPERELVDDWSQGTPLAYVQDVCDVLGRTATTGVAREAALNRFDQFTMPVDGLDRTRAALRPRPLAAPDAMPLLITSRLARFDRRVPQGDRAA
jgi:hypothetical protein